MNKKESPLAYFLLINLALGLILLTYTLFCPRIGSQGFVFYIPPGTAKRTFIEQLKDSHVISKNPFFKLYAFLHPGENLKNGEYFFPKNASFYTIWKQVTNGDGLYYRSFTIVPGWNYSQLSKALATSPYLYHEVTHLTGKSIMEKIAQVNLLPEGLFFPETYRYTRDNSDKVILKKAFQLMLTKLDQEWLRRDQSIPFKSKYEVIIAASLIEKESNLPQELPMIAGVLVNRLKENMLLQFDPTVIYGLGDAYNGKIHRENLLKDTPYNTYLHKGLPPTPIAMPSLLAIHAALHPARHEYFYFVARGDGSHVFSKTLEAHNMAVTQFSGLPKENSYPKAPYTENK